MPPSVTSNESNSEQLALARREGDAVTAAMTALMRAPGIAAADTVGAGPYVISYVISAPEGWYGGEPAGNAGGTDWHAAPAGADAHLRVIVRDAVQGRLIPGLTVRASLQPGGDLHVLPWGRYPLVDGYGDNVTVRGNIAVHVEIDPAAMRRHDPYDGDRYSSPVRVDFAAREIGALQRDTQSPLSVFEEQNEPLARAQGEALDRELTMMKHTANDLGQSRAGDYRVVYAVEFAEAWWHFDDGRFTYSLHTEQSAETNMHFESAILDARTGRFVPGLRVTIAAYEPSGALVAQTVEPLMWHPWLMHYGENARVPRSGRYRIVVRFDPPELRRYGRVTGAAGAAGGEVSFDGANIITGEK